MRGGRKRRITAIKTPRSRNSGEPGIRRSFAESRSVSMATERLARTSLCLPSRPVTPRDDAKGKEARSKQRHRARLRDGSEGTIQYREAERLHTERKTKTGEVQHSFPWIAIRVPPMSSTCGAHKIKAG